MKTLRLLLVLMMPVVMLAACSEYNKVLKSDDANYKYEKALEYYNDGEYLKSIPLLEELLGLWVGLNKVENVSYHYAKAHYMIRDYYMAAYYLKQFTRTYPGSKHAEECAYLVALCHYKNSPKPSLDQKSTYRAIDEMQLFINRYPASARVDTCNTLIDKLRAKLEQKAFDDAFIYYKTFKYKAASVAFENFLRDYPGSARREEVMYLILKSDYELATNSVSSKKEERLKETLNSYRKFVDSYGESRYRREADSIQKQVQRLLDTY